MKHIANRLHKLVLPWLLISTPVWAERLPVPPVPPTNSPSVSVVQTPHRGPQFAAKSEPELARLLQQRNTDIQAALTVIGRRAEGPGAVDLTKANIQGAHLDDAHLSGANLSRAYLREANLSGAHLGDATLSVANLRRTNLSGVYVGAPT